MRIHVSLIAVLTIFGFLAAPTVSLAQTQTTVPAGEVVYVSTGHGNQILRIDANNGSVTVLPISPAPNCNEAFPCDLEGMVVGPDGKIYVADPIDGAIFRLDQSGANFETVFDAPNCESGLCAPQAPAFSGTAARDLYFLDPPSDDHLVSNEIWVIPGAGAVPTGGNSFATPSSSFSCDCTLGEGLAFNGSDNLFFNDNQGAVRSLSQPTYNASTFAGNGPVGAMALSPLTGEIFLADPNTGNIQEGLQDGAPTYYSFNTPNSLDTIQFMAFDATGHLFVATMQPNVEGGGMTNGKVWRIDQGTEGPTATRLADLNALLTAGNSGLTNNNAVGVALPPTQGETQTAPLSSSAGSFTLSWPENCPITLPDSTIVPCQYTFGITYPAGMFPDGSEASVTPKDTTEAQWSLRTPPGNPFNGTQIAPVAGENGSGVIFSAQCLLSDSPCPVPNPSLSYDISTTWKSSQASYCTLGPGLLKADPIGSNDWVNTLTGCTLVSPDPTYGTRGTATCTSTSCLSDWANVFGVKFTFVGFAAPVDNTATNLAKAGQAIPIKFQVLDSSGNPVSTLAMPPVSISSASRSCASGTVSDITLDSTATGNSGFQNLGGGNYQFNWSTSKSWSGTCRQLQVNIGDGVIHTANFQFK